jgi:membrane-bound metal-dependent hydrolase YbcI (DUF457 family)
VTTGSEPPEVPGAALPAADYVRANRLRFTPDALDGSLRKAGYSDTEIGAAWRVLEAEDRAAGRSDQRGFAASVLVGAYAGVWLLYVVAFATVPRSNLDFRDVAFVVFAVVLGVPLLVALVVLYRSRTLRVADRRAAIGALAVPLLVLLVLAGTCLATYPPR